MSYCLTIVHSIYVITIFLTDQTAKPWWEKRHGHHHWRIPLLDVEGNLSHHWWLSSLSKTAQLPMSWPCVIVTSLIIIVVTVISFISEKSSFSSLSHIWWPLIALPDLLKHNSWWWWTSWSWIPWPIPLQWYRGWCGFSPSFTLATSLRSTMHMPCTTSTFRWSSANLMGPWLSLCLVPWCNLARGCHVHSLPYAWAW